MDSIVSTVYVECMLCGAYECYLNFDLALHAPEHNTYIAFTHNSQLLTLTTKTKTLIRYIHLHVISQ